MMYDLYLFTGVHTLPVLEDLLLAAPKLKEPALQHQMMLRSPGFLNLELNADTAVSLMQRLREEKAVGYILPSAYHQPHITVEQATPIAEQALADLRAAQYPDHTLGPVRFLREEPVCWTFGAVYNRNSKLYAYVDKLDAHLWKQSELEQLWEGFYFLREAGEKVKSPYVIVFEGLDQGYDMYLSMGAHTLPVLEDLALSAPALKEPALQQRLVQRSPNLLKLEIPMNVAVNLLQRLRAEGAEGYILPSAYRQPRITVEQAIPIAERAIAELKAASRPDDTLGPVHFLREQPTCWTFGAVSEQLVKEGRIPGTLYASVDKLDGHVWKPEEFERLLGDQ